MKQLKICPVFQFVRAVQTKSLNLKLTIISIDMCEMYVRVCACECVLVCVFANISTETTFMLSFMNLESRPVRMVLSAAHMV